MYIISTSTTISFENWKKNTTQRRRVRYRAKKITKENVDDMLCVLPSSERVSSGLECICLVPVSTELRMRWYLLVAETHISLHSYINFRSVQKSMLVHNSVIRVYVCLNGHNNLSPVHFVNITRCTCILKNANLFQIFICLFLMLVHHLPQLSFQFLHN